MNKNIFRMVLSVAVIIGIAALCAGCPADGGGGDNLGNTNNGRETWLIGSVLKGFYELNGTWKGSFRYTELISYNSGGRITATTYDRLPVTISGEVTWSFNANDNSFTTTQTTKVAFTGENIATIWDNLKRDYLEKSDLYDNGIRTFDDPNYSYTHTFPPHSTILSEREIKEYFLGHSFAFLIKEDRTKIRTDWSYISQLIQLGWMQDDLIEVELQFWNNLINSDVLDLTKQS